MNEPGSRIYVPQQAVAGYGARIWIWRVDAEPVFEAMKKLSKWGGHDKSDGENIAWEFGKDEFVAAVAYLEERGYVEGEGGLPTELLICPNCRKVASWPTSADLGGMDRRGHYCSVACKREYVGTGPGPEVDRLREEARRENLSRCLSMLAVLAEQFDDGNESSWCGTARECIELAVKDFDLTLDPKVFE